MKTLYHIQVKPGSKKPGLEKLNEDSYIIRVREPASDGQANAAAIRALAKAIGLPKSRLEIVRGHRSRSKTVTVV